MTSTITYVATSPLLGSNNSMFASMVFSDDGSRVYTQNRIHVVPNR
jgi:hypothetical protein